MRRRRDWCLLLILKCLVYAVGCQCPWAIDCGMRRRPYTEPRKSNGAAIDQCNNSRYRFAFAADFNLNRRIGAIRRPNMVNVINLGVAWARFGPPYRGLWPPRWYSRIQLNPVTSSACVGRRLPPTRALGIWKAFVAPPVPGVAADGCPVTKYFIKLLIFGYSIGF